VDWLRFAKSLIACWIRILKRFAGKLSNSIPSDSRIAGEVQAIGGKGMKMREKKVVTEKGHERS
jgi:hypothetical protein